MFTAGQPKAAAGVRDIAIPPHIRGIIKAHLKNHVGGGSGAVPFTDDDGSQLRPDRYRPHWEKARKSKQRSTRDTP